MIKTMKDLRAHLAAGHIVSKHGKYEGAGFCLVSDANEPVSPGTLNALVQKGEVFVTRKDLAGNPCEWAGWEDVI